MSSTTIIPSRESSHQIQQHQFGSIAQQINPSPTTKNEENLMVEKPSPVLSIPRKSDLGIQQANTIRGTPDQSTASNLHLPPNPSLLPFNNQPNNSSLAIHDDSPSTEIEASAIFGTPPVGEVGKTKPRAVVRIERDYSARGATCGRVQFWDGWVEELEGRISPLQLQNTLNDFNLILASAHDPYSSIFDNTLAVLSLYLSPWLLGTHYKKQMNLFQEILEQYNRSVYNPVGLNILHPRKVAFLFLEIEYY